MHAQPSIHESHQYVSADRGCSRSWGSPEQRGQGAGLVERNSIKEVIQGRVIHRRRIAGRSTVAAHYTRQGQRGDDLCVGARATRSRYCNQGHRRIALPRVVNHDRRDGTAAIHTRNMSNCHSGKTTARECDRIIQVIASTSANHIAVTIDQQRYGTNGIPQNPGRRLAKTHGGDGRRHCIVLRGVNFTE